VREVVVTTTFYNNVSELRFKLACELVAKAVTAGYPVFIIDASPNPEIAEKLRELGALVFPQQCKGMGPGRRQAFFHATEVASQKNADIVVWTEPEKVSLIGLIPKFTAPIAAGMADIAILRRSQKSWETWPAFQKESEEKANEVYNEVFFTRGFDPMAGPVAFRISMASYFAFCYAALEISDIEDTYIQHYAPAIARAENERVVSIEVDITYPTEQKVEEEQALNKEMVEKRKWQLDTLSKAYRALARSI